ncbi:MAG: LysR family transcriptional regulator [Bradyrhizobium sp.]|nr:MAG: LysR family transcriptional regulator [Bradyrhizobium sp.]
MAKKSVRLTRSGKTTAAPPAQRATATRRKRLRPPRLLTYVDAVARHGSIRKAAEALSVASSALNRQILDLELDLGSELFERLPRGVRLTAVGEVFLAYARQAISELKAVESQVEQLRGLVRGQVGIAAVESVTGELLPSAITQFQAKHPNVRFHVRIGAPDDLVSALIADQVDLILTHHPPPKKSVTIVSTVEQALCALMVADHPLINRDELLLRDCLAYPLALGDATLAGRALIEQALAQAYFDLDPRLISNSVETMKAFVRMNRGVCFQFRRRSGKALIPPGDMMAVPLADPALQQPKLILAARRGRVLPIAAARFVELLKGVMSAEDHNETTGRS